MTTTTDVVERKSVWDTYRRHGYFFREAAMLTIAIGFGMHLYRVIFGDDLALRYVVTPESDILLMIPMTYAAVTGILGYRRMVFANRVHKIALTASLGYITASVPLHLYVAVRAAGRQLLRAHGRLLVQLVAHLRGRLPGVPVHAVESEIRGVIDMTTTQTQTRQSFRRSTTAVATSSARPRC